MKYTLIIVILLTAFSSCYYDNEEELYNNANTNTCDTTNLTYATNMEKIFTNSCAVSGCHVAGTGRHIYDSYTNVKADIDNGTILAKVITNKTMPPGGGLSDCDYKMINAWIKQGAKE